MSYSSGCSLMVDGKTELVFKALFLLEDFRELLRQTAPSHVFTGDLKVKAEGILSDLEKIILELKRLVA